MYEKYKKLRDEKGLTDYRVSQDTGISPSSFSDWKNDKYVPKLDKVKILAEYFGVPIGYFIDE